MRTLVYNEEVHLHVYNTVRELRNGLDRYIAFFNIRLPHIAFDGHTPDAVYFDAMLLAVAA